MKAKGEMENIRRCPWTWPAPLCAVSNVHALIFWLFHSNFHAADAVSGSSVHTQPQLDATESSHPSLHKDLKLWDLPESVKSSLPPGRRHWPALIAVPYKNCGAHVHTTALLGEEGIKTSGLFTACPCRGHQSSMEITGSCPENRYNTLFPDWSHFLGKKAPEICIFCPQLQWKNLLTCLKCFQGKEDNLQALEACKGAEEAHRKPHFAPLLSPPARAGLFWPGSFAIDLVTPRKDFWSQIPTERYSGLSCAGPTSFLVWSLELL